MSVNIKKLSKKQLSIIIAAFVVVAILLAGGIYCGVNQESPVQMFSDMVKSNDEQIVGKWQNKSEPGLSAYEFYDDGTYDNYIGKFSFTGQYTIDGNKLTLTNPSSSNSVVYKISVNGKKLTLKLYKEGNKEAQSDKDLVFEQVDHLNMKSFTDILGDLTTQASEAK